MSVLVSPCLLKIEIVDDENGAMSATDGDNGKRT